jgi:hypothetical protein
MTETNLRRSFLLGLTGAGAAALPARAQSVPGAGVFNVVQFGAARSGRDFDTKAIQAAIDACAAAGGGAVYFPPGLYHSGGLLLRSKVHLYLEAGATLLGSTQLDDYPKIIPKIRSYTDNYTERSLIYGEDLDNVGLHGHGVIDGRGAAFKGPYKVRPYMIRLVSCRDVAVTGLTIRDSPMWVQHYLACDDVLIHGITVYSRVNANNDGIDIDCCERVAISDCNISSGDDAIVLKSTMNRPTRSVAITNCVLSSHCNAFKLGTESNGGFEDIVLSNCTMYDTRLSGIAIEMVDGGLLDGVNVSNVSMRDVKSVIFIRLGDRGRPFEEGGPRPGAGKLRNVQIANVKATGAGKVGCAISGIPGHDIENVLIRDVSILAEGGVKETPDDVPEHPEKYPEHQMFGILPAYGFFCRHVRNIRFDGVETSFADPDERPALVCHDVRQLGLAGSTLAARSTVVRLRQVEGALIHGCRVAQPAGLFLEAAGAKGISLIGNDLAQARTTVRDDGVFQSANRTSG